MKEAGKYSGPCEEVAFRLKTKDSCVIISKAEAGEIKKKRERKKEERERKAAAITLLLHLL